MGRRGGTRDGGAGVTGFGGIGTPTTFGGSGTNGIGGKKRPFWPQSSGVRTANVPAENIRAPPPWRFGPTRCSPRAAHGGALPDGCWRCTEQAVTDRSRLLASCGSWTWNVPRRSVTASFWKTVRPYPSWQRTATRVPEMALVGSEPEWTTEPMTTAAVSGGRACFRPWWAAG